MSRDFQKGVDMAALYLLGDEKCIYVANSLSTIDDRDTLSNESGGWGESIVNNMQLGAPKVGVGFVRIIKEKHTILRIGDALICGDIAGYDSELDKDCVLDVPTTRPLSGYPSGATREMIGIRPMKETRGIGERRKKNRDATNIADALENAPPHRPAPIASFVKFAP